LACSKQTAAAAAAAAALYTIDWVAAAV